MIYNGLFALDTGYLSNGSRDRDKELFHDEEQDRRSENVAEAGSAQHRIFREVHKQAMCIHGSVQADMVTVILPGQLSKRPATFCGRELAGGTFATCLPGDPVTLCTPDQYRYINFSVSTKRLDHAFRVLHQRGLDELIPRTEIRSAPVGLVSRLRWAVRATLIGNGNQSNDATRESEVIVALAVALTAGDPPLASRLATRNYWRCVRRVRDFVEAHLGEPLNVEMLCQVAMVSERTLTTAFREALGVSPLEFVKARRLRAARHLLSRKTGRETSVKWVAGHLGFIHPGNFARDYKMHFGESPSDTLTSHGQKLGATAVREEMRSFNQYNEEVGGEAGG